MIELTYSSVGPWAVNAYVLTCPATQQSVLIDPGAEPDTLHEMLTGTSPVAILITHSHPDHIGSLDVMREQLKVPVMAHPGATPHTRPIAADRWLHDGEVLPLGHHHLRVFHTPGHTRDQVCFSAQDGNAIIVGDTIFPGGPGQTASVQDFKRTLNTLRHIVLTWPDEAICYPGHGPHFRLGEKRSAIEQFLENDHGAYFGDASWEMSSTA